MWHYSRQIMLTISGSLLAGFSLAQEPDFIMFPHQLHVEDMEMECETCHSSVRDATDLSTRLLPVKDDCAVCHDVYDTCEMCHANPDEPRPLSESVPTSGQTFSHAFHLQRFDDCTTCHDYILDDIDEAPPDGWEKADCQTCHATHKPVSHTVDWIPLHGMEVTMASQDYCSLCHTQNSCDQCHQYQPFEISTHPVDFIQVHGFEARAGQMDCASCHDLVQDCVQCHQRNSFMPMDHNFSDWINLTGGGGAHADAAFDAPNVCQACHVSTADETCQRCH